MNRLLKLGLGVLACFAFAGTVSAGDSCSLEVERVTEVFFLFSGSGFAADEEVEVELFFDDQPVLPPATKMADGDGFFSDGITFGPTDEVGTYTMRATAASCTAETSFDWTLPDSATLAPSVTPTETTNLVWLLLATGIAFAYFLLRPLNARSSEADTD